MNKKTVYKSPLIKGPIIQRVHLPLNSAILTIQMQNGNPYLWSLIPEESLKERITDDRTILCMATGGNMPEGNWKYISTIFPDDFVFHYFVLDGR